MKSFQTIIELEDEIRTFKTRHLKRYLNYILDCLEDISYDSILNNNYNLTKTELERRNVNTTKYTKRYSEVIQ